MLFLPPRRQLFILLFASLTVFLCISFLATDVGSTALTTVKTKVSETASHVINNTNPPKGTTVDVNAKKYKPTPTYTPPPVQDPFPLLATSTPPPIPKWNVPRENLHKDYGLEYAPPLLIGFTRTYPVLLQAVVSYITSGWPPSQIYVVENTGVQQANTRRQLSLQNPFFLDHAALGKLGVNIVQTPALLNFAQLQNLYLSMSYARNWTYYFWSHMDVLALPYEDGLEGVTPRYDEPGYRSLYEAACRAANETLAADPRWGIRLFAYDHLALVNRAAYEDVGGWDTLIPYYMTDCDMHSRLEMAGWTLREARAGVVTDVNTVLKDLRALYRDPAVVPEFLDPNPPPPPPPPSEEENKDDKPDGAGAGGVKDKREGEHANMVYYHKLRDVANSMFHYKHGERGRNTWQLGQQGGEGEPFYYPAAGIAQGMDMLTETGRQVFRKKWGWAGCDILGEQAQRKLGDEWRVEEKR